jgi:predicted anti-sigma-YlaC factor YlaD
MNIVKFEQKNCIRIRAFLDSYINDELLVETTHEVLRHLESCPDCGEELRRQQDLKSILKKAVMREVVPDGLEARIKKSIRRNPYADWARWTLVVAATVAMVLSRS